MAAYGRLVVHRAAIYGTVPEDAPRFVALGLAPLALAWLVVLILSFARGRVRLAAVRLARAVAPGGVLMGAVLLPSVLWPRAGGTGSVMTGFGLYSALVQTVAFAASVGADRALRGGVVRSWASAWLPGLGVVLSFALNALVQSQSVCYLGEGRARGTLRALASIEAVYQSSAGGAYGTLRCLREPAACLPSYPANGPVLLDAHTLRPTSCGYRYEFHPGPPLAGVTGVQDALEGFAVTAVPIAPEGSGPKALCIDDSGTLRSSPTGRLPAIVRGRCPDGLEIEG
jgi:hypothetical protein